MILMGMGADHSLQLLHILLLQIGHHQLGIVPVAAVNEDKPVAPFNQGAVRLPHIDEVYQQLRVRLGGGGFRWGKDDLHAAAAQQQGKDQEKRNQFFHGFHSVVRF